MNRTNYVFWVLLEDHFVDTTEMVDGGNVTVRNLDCRQTSITPMRLRYVSGFGWGVMNK